jgi:hypothetical protein
MRRGKQKQFKATIHRYFTRQNTENQKTKEISSSSKPGTSETITTMADVNKAGPSEQLSNADLRQLIVTDLKALIVGSQESLDKKLQDGFADMNENMSNLTTKIGTLELDVDQIRSDQTDDRKQIKNLEGEVSSMRESLLGSQVHARKYNLLIYGLEGYETAPSGTMERVRKFAVEDLKMDENYAKNISFENGHRLQKRDSGPTPIIVVFNHWTDS